MTKKCAHLFKRTAWWWLRAKYERWQCVSCGYLTRTYDGADRWAVRPIHRHMNVALPDYNTVRK